MGTIRKQPQRACIGCGEMKEKKQLIRVVKTPEGEFVLDMTGKKNGRGAYLCSCKACLEAAIKTKGLDRSFKMAVPKEIYDKLREEWDTLAAK
ncbi:RNase P modulator RnpM [Hominifimenecus sp. rT4P-3]